MASLTNDLLYFSIFRWDGPFSSISLAMAKEFSKTRRVFYINHPFTIADIRSKNKEIEMVNPSLQRNKTTYYQAPNFPNLTLITPPAVYSINWLPKGWLYKKMYGLNDRIMQRVVADVIKKYKVKDYFYMNCFDPLYLPVLKSPFQPLVNIYQCVDDLSQSPYLAKHGLALEHEAIRQADITFCTSSELVHLKKPYSDNIHLMHNAADISNFSRAITETFEKPKEIKDIDKEIIGYTGNLDQHRLDCHLLKKIAERYTDKYLVLVGPINNTIIAEIGLDKLPNVILTGGKKIEELPAYLQHFDVCLIPFQKTTLTKSMYPLKTNEYLAAGKPTVATTFCPDLNSFDDTIYLADSHEEFLDKIDRAIKENSKEKQDKRVDKAADNTWKERIRVFDEYMEKEMLQNA